MIISQFLHLHGSAVTPVLILPDPNSFPGKCRASSQERCCGRLFVRQVMRRVVRGRSNPVEQINFLQTRRHELTAKHRPIIVRIPQLGVSVPVSVELVIRIAHAVWIGHKSCAFLFQHPFVDKIGVCAGPRKPQLDKRRNLSGNRPTQFVVP